MDNIKFINSVKFNNKVAIVRVDFNVPLDKNLKITDKTRIKKGISSIKHIIDNSGRCIIISHLGRPQGLGYEKKFSLNNILDCLSNELKTKVKFIDNYYDENFNINKEKVIQTIKERKTLNNEKNKLQITLLGKQVCEFCYEHFDRIFNYDFTNKMEDLLDKIEQGESQQKNVLDKYIQCVEDLIQKTKISYKENPNKITKQDYSLHCGNYKNEVIYIKHGKYGFYLNIGKNEKISLNEFKGFNIEKKIIGIFHDIDSQGNAIIMTKNGSKTYNSGEIKIDGIY